MEKPAVDSPSVQTYLTLLQSVINRMAANSSNCKTWCITLVSAIAVLAFEKTKPNYVWISLIPTILFLFLDSYYLFLEKQFRARYNSFVDKLHAETATIQDLFIIAPGNKVPANISDVIEVFGSFSIWPFYGLLIMMIVVMRIWIFNFTCF